MKSFLVLFCLFAATEAQLWMYVVNSFGDLMRSVPLSDDPAQRKLAEINSRAWFKQPVLDSKKPVVQAVPPKPLTPKVKPLQAAPAKVRPVETPEELKDVAPEIILNPNSAKIDPIGGQGFEHRNFLKNVPRLRMIGG